MARGWGSFWRNRPGAGDASSPIGEGQEMPTAPVRSESFTIGAARPARRGLWTAVVAGLVVLAAVLSAVVLSSNKTNNSASQSSTTTTTSAPGTTATSTPAPSQTIVIPPYTAAPKTAAAGSGSAAKTTTTTTRAATGATSVTTTAVPTACTRQDLLVTTSTDSASYSPGQPVTITTKITDVTACNFQPTTSTNTPCETSAFVGQQQPDNTYREVFPYAAQPESQYCKNPQAGVMYPGGTQYIQYVWSGQVEQDTAGVTTYPNAPDGNYRAYGAWNWTGPSGAVQAIISSDFTVTG